MTRGILPPAPHRAARWLRDSLRDSLRVSILGAALASAAASTALSGTVSAQGGPPNEAQRDPRNRGGGTCTANPYNCVDAVNPLPAPNTVWMEEMTWMDVRDALKAGKTTAIIATGGMGAVYKAVQRSANAIAVGPVMQGLRRPVNDLSRGVTVRDIVNTVAIKSRSLAMTLAYPEIQVTQHSYSNQTHCIAPQCLLLQKCRYWLCSLTVKSTPLCAACARV